MLIGGQAVLLHGDARLTQDIDITLGVGPGSLPAVVKACEALSLRALPQDVEAFVQQTFVLPTVDDDTGIRVDLIFSTTPYEAGAIRRAVTERMEGESVPFASAEDLILHKLFAGRPRDVEDVAGIIRRKCNELDWDYLEEWARELSGVEGRADLGLQLRGLRRAHED